MNKSQKMKGGTNMNVCTALAAFGINSNQLLYTKDDRANQIRNIYRQLRLRTHNSMPGGNREAQRFLAEAYDVLMKTNKNSEFPITAPGNIVCGADHYAPPRLDNDYTFSYGKAARDLLTRLGAAVVAGEAGRRYTQGQHERRRNDFREYQERALRAQLRRDYPNLGKSPFGKGSSFNPGPIDPAVLEYDEAIRKAREQENLQRYIEDLGRRGGTRKRKKSKKILKKKKTKKANCSKKMKRKTRTKK